MLRDGPSLALLEKTRPISDPSFRVLVALETVVPPSVLCYPVKIEAIGRLLPRNREAVIGSLDELEGFGLIVRRETAGHPLVHLLYRGTG